MVPRPALSALALSVTVTSWSLYLAQASLACSGESLARREASRDVAARPLPSDLLTA